MATIYSQVKLATEVNLTLATAITPGVTTIDGVIVYANDRILVKAQTNTVQNGIYTVNSSGVWARASDFASASSQDSGGLIFVTQGVQFADTGWVISTDGPITVGSTGVTFTKVTVNLNIVGANIPSNVVLRSEKGYPLTIEELDNNFKYLAVSLTQKLNTVDFTNIAIRDRLNTLTAAEANLNAWKLDGALPNVNSSNNTIVKRSPDGYIYAGRLYGDVVGTATNANLADYATLAANVDGVVAVTNGGTGAFTAAIARTNLGAVGVAGDTMTGKLTFVAANANGASVNIPPRVAVPNSLVNGDVWTDTSSIYYRLNGVTQTIAKIDSPGFTGAPTAPTPTNESNSTAIATTAFVKNIKSALIDPAIALKSDIASPSFTGTPTVPTIATSDNSTKIANSAYVNNKITAVIADYYTITQTNARIASDLVPYFTAAQVTSAITTNNNSYYTKTTIDSKFTDYYTKSQSESLVNNAVAPRATTSYVDGLQDKWGSSRKFVQSSTPIGAVDGDFWFKV